MLPFPQILLCFKFGLFVCLFVCSSSVKFDTWFCNLKIERLKQRGKKELKANRIKLIDIRCPWHWEGSFVYVQRSSN